MTCQNNVSQATGYGAICRDTVDAMSAQLFVSVFVSPSARRHTKSGRQSWNFAGPPANLAVNRSAPSRSDHEDTHPDTSGTHRVVFTR